MADLYTPDEEGVEYQEHTADLWLISKGKSYEEVLARSLSGLYGVMASKYEISNMRKETMELEGQNFEEVLIDLLSEALFLFDAESAIVIDPKIDVSDIDGKVRVKISHITAEATIPDGHHGMEVKAATYHDAEIVRDGSGLSSKILLDL